MSCPIVDCSDHTVRDLEPNNDISGTGVIISFVGTGYLVLLLLISNYFLAYNPSSNPFRAQSHQKERQRCLEHGETLPVSPVESGWWKPNPIDAAFLGWTRGVGRKFASFLHISDSYDTCSAELEQVFAKCIIRLCDIQILTSLGILISGFVSLSCGISSYHWQIIVYLAWFSTATHISGLAVLRRRKYDRRWKRNVRFVLMLAVLVMLVIALTPTRYFNWAERNTLALQASPAICFLRFRSESEDTCPTGWSSFCTPSFLIRDTSAFQTMGFSIFLAVFTFFTRSVKLFMPLSKALNQRLMRPLQLLSRKILGILASPTRDQDRRPHDAVRQNSVAEDLRFVLFARPALAFFLTLGIIANLLGSMLAEIYWLLIIMIWGTIRIISSRSLQDQAAFQEESQWTFGQMLAVLLLAGPVFEMASTFISKVSNHDPQQSRELKQKADPIQQSDLGRSLSSVASGLQPASDHQNLARHPGSCQTNTADWINRDYYATAPWLWSCSTALCGVVLVITCFTFGAIFNFSEGMSFEPQFTLMDFWFSDFAVFYFLPLGVLPACTATVLVGLSLDRWVQETSWTGGKQLLVCVSAVTIHAVYISVYFLYILSSMGGLWTSVFGRTMSLVIVTASLYVVYALTQICVVLRR